MFCPQPQLEALGTPKRILCHPTRYAQNDPILLYYLLLVDFVVIITSVGLNETQNGLPAQLEALATAWARAN